MILGPPRHVLNTSYSSSAHPFNGFFAKITNFVLQPMLLLLPVAVPATAKWEGNGVDSDTTPLLPRFSR